MSPVLFEFWSGTLYLTIYSRTLRLVFYSTSNFRHVVGLLVSACSMYLQCFDILMAASLNWAQFLLYYASTSVFVGVYRADEKSLKCDVRYIPKFLVVERVMKEVMAFFAVAYQDEVSIDETPILIKQHSTGISSFGGLFLSADCCPSSAAWS